MFKIHFKTAIDYIRRSPFQAFAALFVLSLTFFVATVVAVTVLSSNNLLKYLETRPQIIAFLKSDASREKISGLQTKLNKDLRIKEVRYVPKEEALAIYKQATIDNPLLAQLVSPSIFPASLEFAVKDLKDAQNIIKEIKKIDIVDQVGFTANLGPDKILPDVLNRLKTISLYLRLGGGIFVGVLGMTSFLVLLVIMSMRLTTRKGEIEILDLIGATPGFIRTPIIIEAMIYSVAGVLVGWLFAFILILYAAPSIIAYFGEIPILSKDPLILINMFLTVFALELIIGLVLSLCGTLLAVSRVRR